LTTTYKFGYLDASGAESCYQYQNVWTRQKTKGTDRLVVAPSSRHVELLVQFATVMNEPCGLLYVLHTQRSGAAKAGRYQSPEPITRGHLVLFLQRFGRLLEGDGRHHFWISAVDNSSLVVYDNHNLVYAYGPLEAFEAILRQNNLQETPGVAFPEPHVHRYNAEFDGLVADLMNYWPWKRFPLQNSD
jgi:hypothetical protein